MVETFRVEADWFWRRRQVREWMVVRKGPDALIRVAIAPLTVWRRFGEVSRLEAAAGDHWIDLLLRSSPVALPRHIT